jgi:hypothetical protein
LLLCEFLLQKCFVLLEVVLLLHPLDFFTAHLLLQLPENNRLILLDFLLPFHLLELVRHVGALLLGLFGFGLQIGHLAPHRSALHQILVPHFLLLLQVFLQFLNTRLKPKQNYLEHRTHARLLLQLADGLLVGGLLLVELPR